MCINDFYIPHANAPQASAAAPMISARKDASLATVAAVHRIALRAAAGATPSQSGPLATTKHGQTLVNARPCLPRISISMASPTSTLPLPSLIRALSRLHLWTARLVHFTTASQLSSRRRTACRLGSQLVAGVSLTLDQPGLLSAT